MVPENIHTPHGRFWGLETGIWDLIVQAEFVYEIAGIWWDSGSLPYDHIVNTTSSLLGHFLLSELKFCQSFSYVRTPLI